MFLKVQDLTLIDEKYVVIHFLKWKEDKEKMEVRKLFLRKVPEF